MNEGLIRIETSMQLIKLDVDPETLKIHKEYLFMDRATLYQATLTTFQPRHQMHMVTYRVREDDENKYNEQSLSEMFAESLRTSADPSYQRRKKERIDKLIDSMEFAAA